MTRWLYDANIYVEKQKDPIDGRVLHVKLAIHGEDVLHKACCAKQLLLEKATKSWSEKNRIREIL